MPVIIDISRILCELHQNHIIIWLISTESIRIWQQGVFFLQRTASFSKTQKIDSFILFKLMKNFRGSALAAGVGTPESVPHELLGSSLRFYLVFKHRDCEKITIKQKLYQL